MSQPLIDEKSRETLLEKFETELRDDVSLQVFVGERRGVREHCRRLLLHLEQGGLRHGFVSTWQHNIRLTAVNTWI